MDIPGLHIDLESSVPVYRQIGAAIRTAVLEGRLDPGHRLPPTRDLARELGVNRNTVVAAYEMLAGEGWIRSHTGKGTFVVSRSGGADAGSETVAEVDPWFTAFSRAAEGAVNGELQSIYQLLTSPEGISFVGSYPADELMPVAAFGRAIATALREGGSRVLSYGPTSGDPALRGAIADEMRDKGSPLGPDEILITNGAQQAIELVFRAFIDPGDAVVIEEPTYTGALSVLGALGARVVGVPTDANGIRSDLLAVALERHRPRLIYVQPTFHNPTGRVMSLERRQEVLALARRFQCPVVEDDWAGDLRLEGDELPSLHALDGARHVIYLSTFSKKLMPGLRVGWLAAPPPVLERVVEIKRIEDCGTSPILQAGLCAFLREGGLESHLRRVLPAYRERRDCMLRALAQNFPENARWTRPVGGFFVWVTLPESFDSGDLFAAASHKGVLYSRGELFHSDGSGRNELRLTYSAASTTEIESGVATLGALIRERWPDRSEPQPSRSVEAMPIF